MTRVSTYLMAQEQSVRTYPEIGVPDPHHPLSHHQDDPAKLENRWLVHDRRFCHAEGGPCGPPSVATINWPT